MPPTALPATPLRIASVSYLNAKPLIYGLDRQPDIELSLDVPAKLLERLANRQCDVALLPVIDYQRLAGLTIVPAGGIGCDGPTLTVRIFSRRPIESIRTLACDPDSHTSVALARIVLAEAYAIEPEFVDLRLSSEAPEEARLLIGDKVVCEEPAGFDHQLDLGEAWKRLTGLPFVFAVWMARQEVDLRDLPARLEAAKRKGLAKIDELIVEHAVPRGWPADVARRYLTQHLKYDIAQPQLDAIGRFHALAARHGLIPAPPRPLHVHPD